MNIILTLDKKEDLTNEVIKNAISNELKNKYEIITLNKRGKVFYGVLKDKITKEKFGSKFIFGISQNYLKENITVKIYQKDENTFWNRLFSLKEMLCFTEHNRDHNVRTRSLNNINRKLRDEQLDLYNNKATNKGKRIKKGSILKFNEEIKFSSGFKYDTFKFVNKDNFVLPDESLDTERKYVIYKFRQRDFTIIKEG